jgi:hypothetical protein
MNYLVYTPYRCGSSFLTRLIQKNLNERSVIFLKDINKNTQQEDFLIKGHREDLSILGNRKIDYLFTSIRKPTDIFISAFFKDIKEKDYPYYYPNDICKENTKDMMDFFLSIPWEDYEWLSYEFNFKQIENLTSINLWQEDFDKNRGFNKFVKKDTTLIATTHETLNKNFNEFKDFLSKNLLFKDLDMSKFRFHNYDEFKNLYTDFIKNVPQEFYEKYEELDFKIKQKFL